MRPHKPLLFSTRHLTRNIIPKSKAVASLSRGFPVGLRYQNLITFRWGDHVFRRAVVLLGDRFVLMRQVRARLPVDTLLHVLHGLSAMLRGLSGSSRTLAQYAIGVAGVPSLPGTSRFGSSLKSLLQDWAVM